MCVCVQRTACQIPGFRNQTQVLRLGSRRLYLLSHPTNPSLVTFALAMTECHRETTYRKRDYFWVSWMVKCLPRMLKAMDSGPSIAINLA